MLSVHLGMVDVNDAHLGLIHRLSYVVETVGGISGNCFTLVAADSDQPYLGACFYAARHQPGTTLPPPLPAGPPQPIADTVPTPAIATEPLILSLHRPLRVPTLQPDGSCPQTPLGLTLHFGTVYYASGSGPAPAEQFQGSGPVWVENLYDLALGGLPTQGGWYSQKVFWAMDQREPGPVLVRAVRIDGPGQVGFHDDNVPELVLEQANVGAAAPYRVFVDGVSVRTAGCYLMQMDGVATTTTIVFRAVEPAGGPTPSPSPSAPPWAALAARPLTLPTYAGVCSIGPHVKPSAAFTESVGSGRVFLAGLTGPISLAGTPPNADGTYPVKSLWVVTGAGSAQYPAPVIIRGARISRPGEVRFEGGVEPLSAPLMYLAGGSGIYSAGEPSTWQEWATFVDYPGPGCYVLQVDGADVSKQMTVEIVP
jgi:hypothetical protein